MSLHQILHLVHHHELRSAAILFALVLLVIGLLIVVRRRRPRELNPVYFAESWHELQKLLPNRSTWDQAVVEADKLLDEALRKRRFRGKTMGERLVSAQHEIKANDMVWFGHKLCNKLKQGEYKLSRKAEVKDALLGYWQALRDLGAFKNDK